MTETVAAEVADIRKKAWYYSVELRPGAFTSGQMHQNMLVTKALLGRIDLRGTRLLDVGAMEGLFSVLAARAGADVTAYDRFDLRV